MMKNILLTTILMAACCILVTSCDDDHIIEPYTPYAIEKPLIDFFGSDFIGNWSADSIKINGKDLTPYVKFDMRLNADTTTTLFYQEQNTFYGTTIRDTINGYWTFTKNRDKLFVYHSPVIVSREETYTCGGSESSYDCKRIVYSTAYTIDSFSIKGLSLGLGKDVMRVERGYKGYLHQYRLIRQ